MIHRLASPAAARPRRRMSDFVFDKQLEQFLERQQQRDGLRLAWTDETVLTGDRWPLTETKAKDSLIGEQYSKEPG